MQLQVGRPFGKGGSLLCFLYCAELDLTVSGIHTAARGMGINIPTLQMRRAGLERLQSQREVPHQG